MIDRSGWERVRFGDVIDNINQHTKDFPDERFERLVGLEHLDGGNIHISRWNENDGSSSFTRVFHKGHTLFGKRRAYQKKVALAEFDGICSGDILVFGSKHEGIILSSLIPFICMSKHFYHYVEANAQGSLSPRVSFKALSQYEFLLPPTNEQKRIAELLWTADSLVQKHTNVLHSLNQTQESLLARSFVEEADVCSPLGEIITACQYGLSLPLSTHATYPVFRMMNIVDGKVVANEMKYIDLNKNELEKYRLSKGDILFNRTNSAELVGKVGIFELEGEYVFASYLIRLRANTSIVLPQILNYILNMARYQKKIRAYTTYGVSQSNINADNLRKVKIPILPLPEQHELLTVLNEMDKSIQNTVDAIAQTKNLLQKLINYYLGGAS